MATKKKPAKATAPKQVPAETDYDRRIARIRQIIAAVYLGDIMMEIQDEVVDATVPIEMFTEASVALGDSPEGISSELRKETPAVPDRRPEVSVSGSLHHRRRDQVMVAILRPLCRHCNRLKVHRPRGLCWTCYYTPGVRELYPSTSKYARRGVGNGGRSPLPATPTTAPPGSAEKLDVLCEQARRRESLFHPLDKWYLSPLEPLPRCAGRHRPLKITRSILSPRSRSSATSITSAPSAGSSACHIAAWHPAQASGCSYTRCVSDIRCFLGKTGNCFRCEYDGNSRGKCVCVFSYESCALPLS